MATSGLPRILHKRSVQFHAIAILQAGLARGDTTPDSAFETRGLCGNQPARQRSINCVSDRRFAGQLECFEDLGSGLCVDNLDSDHDKPATMDDDGR